MKIHRAIVVIGGGGGGNVADKYTSAKNRDLANIESILMAKFALLVSDKFRLFSRLFARISRPFFLFATVYYRIFIVLKGNLFLQTVFKQ